MNTVKQPHSNPESGKAAQHLRLDPPPCRGKECDYFRRAQEPRAVEAALRKILGEIEGEKTKIHDSIGVNVEKILMPALRALEGQVPEQQKKHVALLKKYLADFASPFALNVSKACGKLTPAEIEICNMIRNGMSTKEIARLRHVTTATVSKQRERIRRKLDIAKTETNLAAHLHGLASEHDARPDALFT